MKNILTSLFVLLPLLVVSQNFIPVWESSYLPNQESGCYVSSIYVNDETIHIIRTCKGEREVVFGETPYEFWTDCDIPDSLGEAIDVVSMGEGSLVFTSSNWIVCVNKDCETSFIIKVSGFVGLEKYNDTIFAFGSFLYGADSPGVFYLDQATYSWYSLPYPTCDQITGFTVLEGKYYISVFSDASHKILCLEDSVWETKYIFPENEYFTAWKSFDDRIYVASTNISFPDSYAILSEFKDGDMDSLFASDGNILAIEATPCFVFCVGSFTNFGNCDAENLSIFDRITKEVVPTDRGLDGSAYTVSSNEEFVYVGGAFMYGADIYSPGVISLPSCYETSAENISEKEIRVFPNPTQDFLFVENGAGKDVRIFSLSKEIYLMANEVDNKKVFDLINLPAGTYYLLIDGKTFSFIKL